MSNWSPQQGLNAPNKEIETTSWGVPAAAELNGKLYVVYPCRGNEEGARLELISCRETNGNFTWSDAHECKYGENFSFSIDYYSNPALIAFDGKLIMIWAGSGHEGLYAAKYDPESGTWSAQFEVKICEKPSESGSRIQVYGYFFKMSGRKPRTSPAVTLVDGKLMLAWVGVDDHELYYAEMAEGFDQAPFYQNSLLFKEAIKIKKENQFGIVAYSSPSLVTLPNNNVMLAWAGSGEDGIYYSILEKYKGEWSNQVRTGNFGIKENTSPSLSRIGNRILMAWHGVHKEDGLFMSEFGVDKKAFGPQQQMQSGNIYWGSQLGPALCQLNNNAFMLWHSYSDDQLYYSYEISQGGILIIGSLYWQIHSTDVELGLIKEPDEARKKWRDTNLDFRNEKAVKVPIRYGRYTVKYKDKKRYNSLFTMVFSKGLSLDDFGSAFVVPLQSRYSDGKSITTYIHAAAENLAKAEGIWTDEHPYITTEWGAVSIIINPQSVSKEIIEKTWKSIYSASLENGEEYAKKFAMDTETSIVDGNGILDVNLFDQISDSGLDFVLTSITEPRLDLLKDANGRNTKYPDKSRYPEAAEIANFSKQDRRKYFQQNRTHNITTFEDGDIESSLPD